jgi:hypothetical protein
LREIERSAFSWSRIHSIMIPRNVEIIRADCFVYCNSLSSVTFESHSKILRIETRAFDVGALREVVIPPSVCFIDGHAFHYESQITSPCPELSRWCAAYLADPSVPFRRENSLQVF